MHYLDYYYVSSVEHFVKATVTFHFRICLYFLTHKMLVWEFSYNKRYI